MYSRNIEQNYYSVEEKYLYMTNMLAQILLKAYENHQNLLNA